MKSVYFCPVYDEIRELPIFLEDLAAADLPCSELLFVNNGSSDGSEELVRSAGYPFLDLPENLGVGYSYMLAVDWAIENGFDVFGTIATNGKMLPSEMPRVLGPVLRGEVDYVTGSRFMEGGASPNLPEFRARAIPWVNRFVRALTGVALTDATCGYRAFRLDVFRTAEFDWHDPWLNTYGFEYYCYAKVLLDGRWRCTEVPVTMRYPARRTDYSKVRPFVGWYQMLKPWVVARADGTGYPDDIGQADVATT